MKHHWMDSGTSRGCMANIMVWLATFLFQTDFINIANENKRNLNCAEGFNAMHMFRHSTYLGGNNA